MKIKKFTSIKTLKDIEILSPIGYVPLKNIMKTIEYDVYRVNFVDGSFIDGADNHILIDYQENEVYIKDLKGGELILSSSSENSFKEVKNVENIGKSESMYDVQMEYYHKFYSNGVLSHNTTTVAAYICHQTIFNEEYSTAVLANKAAGSREVLLRIKQMYESLPWFLQMGVKEWNKGRIELGNMSKVISAASSTSSIRGNSINCVSMDTKVTVRNKHTKIEEEITISDLELRLGNS